MEWCPSFNVTRDSAGGHLLDGRLAFRTTGSLVRTYGPPRINHGLMAAAAALAAGNTQRIDIEPSTFSPYPTLTLKLYVRRHGKQGLRRSDLWLFDVCYTRGTQLQLFLKLLPRLTLYALYVPPPKKPTNQKNKMNNPIVYGYGATIQRCC